MSSEDRELMSRAARGDVLAFGRVASRYRSRLESVGLRLVHCPSAAEDVAQETLTRALEQVRRYRHAAEPRTWLHSIALHVCHHWRRSRKRPLYTSNPDVLERDRRHIPAALGVLPRVLRRETDRLLRLALDDLTPHQRDAFVLHCLEGLQHETVARRLKTTCQGVRALCLRARRELRRRLARHLLATP